VLFRFMKGEYLLKAKWSGVSRRFNTLEERKERKEGKKERKKERKGSRLLILLMSTCGLVGVAKRCRGSIFACLSNFTVTALRVFWGGGAG